MITTLVFTEEIVTSLDAVMGRKHPNAVQAKQLRSSLPLIHVFLHLVTSQVNSNNSLQNFKHLLIPQNCCKLNLVSHQHQMVLRKCFQMLSLFNNWCNNAVNVKIRMFVLKSQDFNYFWKSQITFWFFFSGISTKDCKRGIH